MALISDSRFGASPGEPEPERLHAMRVLVIDDNPANVALLVGLLEQDGYQHVRGLTDSTVVTETTESFHPDLILLDVHMPNWSGLDVLDELSALTRSVDNLPIIVVTADQDHEVRYRALDAGARDFVTKPVDAVELLLRVRTHLITRQLQRECIYRNERLEYAVQERTYDLERARTESLTILASVAEYHDDDTAEHTQRVGLLSERIARALGTSAEFSKLIRSAAPLHDLGKIGVDREILTFPGQLSEEQMLEMRKHVDFGSDMLSSAESPVLQMAREIVFSHHEHWDGGGYPLGIGGAEISLAGRIVAVADVFDALTHDRPYKPAWRVHDAVDLICEQAGHQFDPAVVKAFLRVLAEAGQLTD